MLYLVTTMRQIIAIAYNWRSCHNVGSLLRTAEGLSAEVMLCGYTPCPRLANDTRLPHEIRKIEHQIEKTALGAQRSIKWHYQPTWRAALAWLHREEYTVFAVEQSAKALPLQLFHPPPKAALLYGNEATGLPLDVLNSCQTALEIPMFGKKESYNVVQTVAMSLYHCRFYDEFN